MFIIMIVVMIGAAATVRSWRGVLIAAAIWSVATTALHLGLKGAEGAAAPSAAMLLLFAALQFGFAAIPGLIAFGIRYEMEVGRRKRRASVAAQADRVDAVDL